MFIFSGYKGKYMKKLLVLLICVLLLPSVSLASEAEQFRRLERQCIHNRLDSCVRYAEEIREDSPEFALIPMLKACNGGNMKGCTGLAALYSDEENGTAPDLAKAKKLYARACKGGEQTACRKLKTLSGKKQSSDSKSEYLERLENACNLGNAIPCVEQVAYYCAEGNARACESLCESNEIACSIKGRR